MPAEQTYNGWMNYETWAVALWIDNDEGTNERRVEMAAEALEHAQEMGHSIWTLREHARFDLADALKAWVTDDLCVLPDHLQSSMAGDLLGAALSEVNWGEISDNWLSDLDAYATAPGAPETVAG